MRKSFLKALFINAKAEDARYIGVRIQTEGNKKPEIIINPRENFDEKFSYYMDAYDDDLILIAAKGKKEIKITGIAQGYSFEDIECQLIGEKALDWKKTISDSIEKVYKKAMKETPPKSEEERLRCEAIKESIKGMFINRSRTATEARFMFEHAEEYEKLFEVCMNGDETEFRRGLIELQRLQNEYILREEKEQGDE